MKIEYEPIGIIHTEFKEPKSMPVQPGGAKGIKGTVEIFPDYEDGLKDMTWERSGDKISSDLLPYFERGISLKNMGFKSGDQFYTPVIDETFWTFFSQNLLPIMTFATTFLFFYYQYQRDLLYIESGRLR